MSFGEETQETNKENQDVDKDVLYILYGTLTESQIHKDIDDHIHEDVEIDIVMGDGDVVNAHDHAREDGKTLCEDVISKDKSLLMGWVINRKVYELFTKGTQSIDDMTPYNDEDFDLIGLDMKKVINDK